MNAQIYEHKGYWYVRVPQKGVLASRNTGEKLRYDTKQDAMRAASHISKDATFYDEKLAGGPRNPLS